ncbi:hypothetical protein SERLA73DRAFT_187540 [Serpula lacrymans var. lacrymans S7.3]|uniref:Uncharacterized protein n=1 Tax=Serpula lacrymans var. lacrymans (strain S7.3) TaxID=936435 RepID=F8Q9F7_SERL3|nr:hypothetical protein SERLA73DRAFT_187540 [Serpula lacrymans var. lacrymans S7.3]
MAFTRRYEKERERDRAYHPVLVRLVIVWCYTWVWVWATNESAGWETHGTCPMKRLRAHNTFRSGRKAWDSRLKMYIYESKDRGFQRRKKEEEGWGKGKGEGETKKPPLFCPCPSFRSPR